MEPIRVAQIIGKWVGGGVEAVIMNYYRHIDHSKVQFDFICDNDSTNIPYKEIESLGGKVILIPPYQKIIRYHKELKKILKETNYRIVHSHINTLSVFPLFAAYKARVPVRIAHSHSTTNKKEWKKNLMKQALRPLSKIFATHYFCCTEHAGRWLFGNKEFEKGNVFVLNNAINLDDYKFNKIIRSNLRKELNIKDDTIVIGHIGRFMKQKNHEFIIKVFNEYHKHNSDSLLLLVGQGPLESKIKQLVHSLNLEDSVKFLGQRNDANKIYQAMDIFLFPSLYEGLGMVAIEAQATGLPCICSSEVPKDVKMTALVNCLHLSDPIEDWVKALMEANINDREDKTKEIQKAGYDIKKESKKLEEAYLKR